MPAAGYQSQTRLWLPVQKTVSSFSFFGGVTERFQRKITSHNECRTKCQWPVWPNLLMSFVCSIKIFVLCLFSDNKPRRAHLMILLVLPVIREPGLRSLASIDYWKLLCFSSRFIRDCTKMPPPPPSDDEDESLDLEKIFTVSPTIPWTRKTLFAISKKQMLCY